MKAILAAILLAVFVLPACKKDRTQPPPTTPAERNVQISFEAGTIPFSQVDSASIIMKKTGSANPHFRRFDKATGMLKLLMDDNLSGNWTAELYVYTTVGNNNHLYQRNIGLSLPLASDLKLTGPADEANGVWLKLY